MIVRTTWNMYSKYRLSTFKSSSTRCQSGKYTYIKRYPFYEVLSFFDAVISVAFVLLKVVGHITFKIIFCLIHLKLIQNCKLWVLLPFFNLCQSKKYSEMWFVSLYLICTKGFKIKSSIFISDHFLSIMHTNATAKKLQLPNNFECAVRCPCMHYCKRTNQRKNGTPKKQNI